MAEKRKDFKEYGYEDERFESVISDCHNLHCAICSNVFKDPVMCKNEHCFCRACITEHLKNSQNCPCCNHHLSMETLSDAPRILRNLLSELKIRCDYHERGCEEFVQLGNLASHVATCAKAPVVCANEECSSEMNREDQARHESEECRFRKVKCRNCKEMDAMMQEIGASLGGLCEQVTKLNTNVNEQLSEMKTGLIAMENRFEKVENHFLQMGDPGLRDERREAVHDVKSTRNDQAIQADLASDVAETKNPVEKTYIVAGGFGVEKGGRLSSVEIFDKTISAWRQLQSMKKCRANASSVVYKGQIIVTGGISDSGDFSRTLGSSSVLSCMEELNVNPNPLGPPYWSLYSANLPRMLQGHWCVMYNNRLLLFGGYDQERSYSKVIYEIQLDFPFNTKILAKMPFISSSCGFARVDDKIFILGGSLSTNANVTMYDITKNEFKELAPLPYKVRDMATAKYGENVNLAGGYGGSDGHKNSVISYNIETQKSVMLPPMKEKRSQCHAVVDGDSIVVMGGNNGTSPLKSVEAFDFRSSKWRNLASMNEARRGFVAEIV